MRRTANIISQKTCALQQEFVYHSPHLFSYFPGFRYRTQEVFPKFGFNVGQACSSLAYLINPYIAVKEREEAVELFISNIVYKRQPACKRFAARKNMALVNCFHHKLSSWRSFG